MGLCLSKANPILIRLPEHLKQFYLKPQEYSDLHGRKTRLFLALCNA